MKIKTVNSTIKPFEVRDNAFNIDQKLYLIT